jgi:hypothetical protein
VRLAERQIGLSSLTIDTLADGIRVTERLDLTIPQADGTRRVLATADAELSLDLRLRHFTTTWAGTAERLQAAGRMEGDSILIIETTDSAGAVPERVRIPVRGVLTTSAAAPLRVAFGRGLTTGTSLRVMVLDPLRLALRPVTLSVAAESVFVVPDSASMDPTTGEWSPARLDTVPAWHLVEDDGRGARWVDAAGYPVVASTVEGLALERSAFEIVNSSYRDDRADSAWTAHGILPRGSLRRAPARSSLTALVADSGFVLTGDGEIGGGPRRWNGDTLAPTGTASADELPPNRAETMPGPFVPSADPRIGAQARRIVASINGRGASAAALAEWVSETLTLDPDGPSGALAAFTEHRGTAVAHAALFVAMARAVGLPARIVGGVVAAPDGRWYRHTWAEVYVERRWIAADPAYARYPADASYLRLSAGRPGSVLAVDPIAARLTPLRESR